MNKWVMTIPAICAKEESAQELERSPAWLNESKCAVATPWAYNCGNRKRRRSVSNAMD